MLVRNLNVLSLFVASTAVYAQDLGVPLSWREFSNSRGTAERITIAQNAINAMMGQVNNGQFNGIGYWQAANAWSAMAIQDRLAGTTVNKANVVNSLNSIFAQFANYDQFGFNDDALWWATAAYYGYKSYGDGNLLSHAEATWNHVSAFQIQPSQTGSTSFPGKSFSFSGTCEGKTMAGGVWWRPTSDDTSVNSVTTGLFLTLSAFLAEATGDSKYTNAAILSAQWIQSLQINAQGIVLDTVSGHDCSRSPSTWLFTYNSGKFIEGLSVLAAVTGNSNWNQLMITTLNNAVKSSAWEGSDGIITEGSDTTANNDGVGFKAILIRAIREAWERNPSNTALRTLIHSYGDVQYNALLELAANGSTYSANWHGPPQAFTSWGQLAALDVMVTNVVTN